MERDEHERLADELGAESERMQRRSEELEHRIEDSRQDWEAKRNDPGVPGAPEPRGDEQDGDAEA